MLRRRYAFRQAFPESNDFAAPRPRSWWSTPRELGEGSLASSPGDSASTHLQAPPIADQFAPLFDSHAIAQSIALAGQASERWAGNVIWNINPTAQGGGVAEMLRPILLYSRGAGVDTRWLVLDAPLDFFHFTRRLHHTLHGSRGDRSQLGIAKIALYKAVL